jgi:hypothetical protein
MSASAIEHKRQVSVAVDLIHSDKKRRKSKRKKLYSEDGTLAKNAVPQDTPTSNGRASASIQPVRLTDHTFITSEPHPLITSADLSSYSISSTYNSNNNSNISDVSKTPHFSRGRLANTLVGVARGVAADEVDDNEYFSELVGSIGKNSHNSVSQ